MTLLLFVDCDAEYYAICESVHSLCCDACRYLGSDVSGMVIVEIHLLTGHVANDVDGLQKQSSLVKRVESDQSKIVLYLDEVSENSFMCLPSCFRMEILWCLMR